MTSKVLKEIKEVCGGSVPGRVNSKCKGPEAGKLKEQGEKVVGDKDRKVRRMLIM